MDDIEEKKISCFGENKLPCARFCIAAGVSLASFTIGCVMLITLPSTSPLIPFYSSLITGCLSYWVHPPSMNDK